MHLFCGSFVVPTCLDLGLLIQIFVRHLPPGFFLFCFFFKFEFRCFWGWCVFFCVPFFPRLSPQTMNFQVEICLKYIQIYCLFYVTFQNMNYYLFLTAHKEFAKICNTFREIWEHNNSGEFREYSCKKNFGRHTLN